MVIFMIKYFIIQRIKKEGASHLPPPPVGCSCLDDGPIPTAPPKTSMVTNHYICKHPRENICLYIYMN